MLRNTHYKIIANRIVQFLLAIEPIMELKLGLSLAL